MRRNSLSTVVFFGLWLVVMVGGWWWLTWHALATIAPVTIVWPLWVKAVLSVNFLVLVGGVGLKFR